MNLQSRTEHVNSFYLLWKVVQLLNKSVYQMKLIPICGHSNETTDCKVFRMM